MLSTFSISTAAGPIFFDFDDLGGRDYIAQLVKGSGLAAFEAPLPALIVNLSRSLGGTFCDVGANSGIYALLAGAANPNIRVAAFEPLAEVRKALQANVILNPLIQARLSIHDVALSSSSGTADFFETINDQGLLSTSSSLDVDQAHRTGAMRTISVQTTTFDAWCRSNEVKPSFVKIDVEGHERSVFEGATDVFGDARPIVILELLAEADFPFFDDFLSRHSYADIALYPTLARQIARPYFIYNAWNHVLCPVEKLFTLAAACARSGIELA